MNLSLRNEAANLYIENAKAATFHGHMAEHERWVLAICRMIHIMGQMHYYLHFDEQAQRFEWVR